MLISLIHDVIVTFGLAVSVAAVVSDAVAIDGTDAVAAVYTAVAVFSTAADVVAVVGPIVLLL